jgi:hypothetical protein
MIDKDDRPIPVGASGARLLRGRLAIGWGRARPETAEPPTGLGGFAWVPCVRVASPVSAHIAKSRRISHANRWVSNTTHSGLFTRTPLGTARIWLVGQLELATTRADIPLDPYVLHELGVASPADPTDGLAHGPPFSGLWPGPILLPRANVAGLSMWGDDLHHPWRCPSSLKGSLTRIAPFGTTAWSGGSPMGLLGGHRNRPGPAPVAESDCPTADEESDCHP